MPAASTNGTKHAPHNRLAEPLANGDNGRHAPPSANGDNGAHPPPAPSANGDNGRDAAGRFAKGNPGGPGNPFARRLAQLRSALLATVTEEDVRAVIRRLVELALGGDVAAARLLLAYAVGRPAEAVDPDTLDLQEWGLLRQTPVKGDDLIRALTGMPLELACMIVRTALPHLTIEAARLGQEMLRNGPTGPDGEDSRARPSDKGPGGTRRKRPAKASAPA